MGIDKRAAARGLRRVSEFKLILLAFLGGWPGTLVAMRWYHHKRRKTAFKLRCLVASSISIYLTWTLFYLWLPCVVSSNC